jgi:hypothetical protein
MIAPLQIEQKRTGKNAGHNGTQGTIGHNIRYNHHPNTLDNVMQKLQGEILSSDRLMKSLLLTIASTSSQQPCGATDCTVHFPLSLHPIPRASLICQRQGAAAASQR